MCFKVLKILKCFMYLKLELFKNSVPSTISNLKLGYISFSFRHLTQRKICQEITFFRSLSESFLSQ